MKKLFMLFAVVLTFTLAHALDKGKWTGFIGDDKCGVKGNNKDHADCARSCVQGGAKPVFVVSDKVYTISNPEKVEKFVGEEVTIKGTITNDVLEIKSVKK